jgi:hypothetical protein
VRQWALPVIEAGRGRWWATGGRPAPEEAEQRPEATAVRGQTVVGCVAASPRGSA